MATVLTPAQKQAGRIFREQAAAAMEQQLPEGAITRPATLHFVRHECPLHEGRTWAVELKEHYILNPPMDGLEEGVLAFIWRAGRCSCGFAVCSDGGRVVAAADHTFPHGARQVEMRLSGV